MGVRPVSVLLEKTSRRLKRDAKEAAGKRGVGEEGSAEGDTCGRPRGRNDRGWGGVTLRSRNQSLCCFI